jgi:threonine dehydrogenase-like Zn-dependent dehydrogenase
MKAAFLIEKGRLEVCEVPVPEISESDVLIKLEYASICGTDLKIYNNGHFKLAPGQRRVLGHEVFGTIAEIGSAVRAWSVGQRVAVTPNIGCGKCKYCLRGANQMCPEYEAFGITLDGGFQEFMKVPGWTIARGNLFNIPDEIDSSSASLLEPFSCCHSGQKPLDIKPDDVVLIIGAGPIGCLHTVLAKRAGSRKVIVANTKNPRLEIAKKCGADVTVNVAEKNLREEVLEATKGDGADVIVTAVAKPDVITESITMLSRYGRLNVFSGLNNQSPPVIDVNSLHYKAQVLTGTTGSSNLDFLETIQIARENRIPFSELITGIYSLEDINDAFNYAASGAGMKTVIKF